MNRIREELLLNSFSRLHEVQDNENRAPELVLAVFLASGKDLDVIEKGPEGKFISNLG